MEIKEIPINKISPSPFQPRETFDKAAIQELADSIKEFDLLNPILVKPLKNGNFQIIAGERRWRAAQYAGLTSIAAIVKDIDNRRQRIESLIENVHRKDLDSIEKGRGVLEIFNVFGIDLSSKELAKILANITNKQNKKIALKANERKILEICSKIHIKSRVIRTWLESISIDSEIIKEHLNMPYEERIPEHTLARLSTIEDKELQKLIYKKIKAEDMGQIKASKFVTQIKKLPKEEREAILTSSIPVEIIGDRTEGYSIEIPEEEIEKLRQAVEMGQRETEAVLLKPIVRERGLHRRNWQAHLEILTVLDNLVCPYCGELATTHLRWLCHDDKSMEDCKDRAGKNFEEAGKREEVKEQFLRK